MVTISALIFMIFFILNLPSLNIDNLLFQITFLLININESIPLVKELLPPKFTPEQKAIFKNYFKNYLNHIEFKKLLSKHRRRVYKVTSSLLNKGNGFSSIFLVAKLQKSANKIVLRNSNSIIMSLTKYSWIGK